MSLDRQAPPPPAVTDPVVREVLGVARRVGDVERHRGRVSLATVVAVEPGRVLVAYAGVGTQSLPHLDSCVAQPGDTVAIIGAEAGRIAVGVVAPRPDAQAANLELWRQVSTGGQPGFENGWANLAGDFAPAGFWRDPDGFVHLRGVVGPGTPGARVFTLPPGYRPAVGEMVTVHDSGSAARLDVTTDGAVTPQGTGTYVSLDGVSFQAALVALHDEGRHLGYGDPSAAAWRALPLSRPPYEPLGTDDRFGPPGWHVNRWGLVRLRGAAATSSGAASGWDVLARLPDATLGLGRDHLVGVDSSGEWRAAAAAETGELVRVVVGARSWIALSGLRWFTPAHLGEWAEVDSFANGWEHYEDPLGYVRVMRAGWWRDPFGVVHLRGAVAGGSTAGEPTMFSLPEGYRPGARVLCLAEAAGGGGRVDVWPDGRVVYVAGGNTRIGLSGLMFRAEA